MTIVAYPEEGYQEGLVVVSVFILSKAADSLKDTRSIDVEIFNLLHIVVFKRL